VRRLGRWSTNHWGCAVAESFAAEIPEALWWADALLTQYGRWCTTGKGARRCGSAEGNYRAPAGEDDARRTGVDPLPSSVDAMRTHRALVRVADLERVVLHVLYVPQRLPVQAQVRMLRLTPPVVRQRHLDGLRMFANLHRIAT
jgi:hypothetical protein